MGKRRSANLHAVLVAIAAIASAGALAGEHSWVSQSDGYWNDASNWLSKQKINNATPAASDTVSSDGRVPLGINATGIGDDAHVLDGAVINDGGTYKMWYSGYDGANWRIYYATSPDGLTWTKYNNATPANSDSTSSDGRIPLGTAGTGDSAAANTPAVIKDGSTYKMWYSGSDGSNVRIYYATSPDGLTWTKLNNAIPADSNASSTDGRLPRGTPGTGDDTSDYAPAVIKDGGLYLMWYTGYDGSGYRIYHATSTDGLIWTKVNNTIPADSDTTGTDGRIPLGTTGAGDATRTLYPAVIKDGGLFKMWYGGFSSLYRIYAATSPDGLTWTKVNNATPATSNDYISDGRVPLGTNGTGDDAHVLGGTVIQEGGQTKMWYSGHDGSGWRMYYAVFGDGSYPNASGDTAWLTATGSNGADIVRNVTLGEDITVGYIDFAQGATSAGHRYYIQSGAGEVLTFDDPSGKARVYGGYWGGGTHLISAPIQINTLLEVRGRWGRMQFSGKVAGTATNPDVEIDVIGYVSGAGLTINNNANDFGAGTLNVRAPVSSWPATLTANAGTGGGLTTVIDSDDTVHLYGGLSTTTLSLIGHNTVTWGSDVAVHGSTAVIVASRAVSGDLNGLFIIGSLTLDAGVTLQGRPSIGYDIGIGAGEALTLGSGSTLDWSDDFWINYVGDLRLLSGSLLQGDGLITLEKIQGSQPGPARCLVLVDAGATVAPGIGTGGIGILTVQNLRPPGPGNRGEFPIPIGAGATLDIDITTTGAGTGHDQLKVLGGAVSLAGNLIVHSPAATVPPPLVPYVIIDNDDVDAVSGTFAGLAEGATVTDDQNRPYTISYVGGDGNDVTLTSPCDCTLFTDVFLETFCAQAAVNAPVSWQALQEMLSDIGDSLFPGLGLTGCVQCVDAALALFQ